MDAETSQDAGRSPAGAQDPRAEDATAQPSDRAETAAAQPAAVTDPDAPPKTLSAEQPVEPDAAAKGAEAADEEKAAKKAAAKEAGAKKVAAKKAAAKTAGATPPGPEAHPLVAEAMKKAPLVWLEIDGRAATPAWCVWLDGALYVVSGPGEQPVPGLDAATEASVVVRSADNLARIVRWPAAVRRVRPGTEEWDASVTALLAKRLNLTDTESAAKRWAETCAVSRLEPAGDPDQMGDTLPDTGHRAAPPPTPAATRTTVPYTLGRGRGRRRQH